MKSGKNEKLAKNGEKGPNMDFFGFPTLFATIFITQAQQTGQKKPFSAFSGDFWSFLVRVILFSLKSSDLAGQLTQLVERDTKEV